MRTVAKALVALIVCGWAVTTLILPFVIDHYTTPPEVGTAMGAVAGAAAAALFINKGSGKD